MENLTEFIKQEKQKRPQQQPQNNIKNSLLSLKNALDGFENPSNNPILENVKKVDNMVEVKTNPNIVNNNGFVQPKVNQNTNKQQVDFNEKDDLFERELLMKSKQLANKLVNKDQMINEETYHPPKVEQNQQFEYNYQTKPMTDRHIFDKSDALKALKDTITDLYVNEKIENVIKEYLQTDEGKKLIKSIVIGLFKKK
mgnify:CR=1 FL=1